MPMLSGNLVSLLSSFFITVPISLMAPQNYDFESTKAIDIVSDEQAVTVVEYNVAEEEDPAALERVSGQCSLWAIVRTRECCNTCLLAAMYRL